MLFAGFSVSKGELTLFGIVAAGVLGNLVGSWIAYAVGYYGRARPAGKEQADPHQPQAPEMGRRLVRALRRRDRLLLADAADRPHLHLAAGRGGEDAVLALHRLHPARLASPGCWRWRSSAKRSATTGRTGATTSATSTTWSWRRSSPASSTGRQAAARRRPGGDGEPADARAGRHQRRLSERRRRLPARRAVALGIVQGPAELLPVSSSAHIVLVPWLAGWDWEAIDPEVRKSFEVALHTGAAAALLIGQRRLIAEELRAVRRPPGARSSASPSCRRRSSATRSSGRSSGASAGRGRPPIGLLAGAAAMLVADRRPQRRGRGEATPADGLALGVAQAAALAPGVSRNGVTLAAARWRRFSRDQANLLSRTIALPIIVGATALKGARLRPPRHHPGAAPLARRRRRAPPSPRPSPPSA